MIRPLHPLQSQRLSKPAVLPTQPRFGTIYSIPDGTLMVNGFTRRPPAMGLLNPKAKTIKVVKLENSGIFSHYWQKLGIQDPRPQIDFNQKVGVLISCGFNTRSQYFEFESNHYRSEAIDGKRKLFLPFWVTDSDGRDSLAVAWYLLIMDKDKVGNVADIQVRIETGWAKDRTLVCEKK